MWYRVNVYYKMKRNEVIWTAVSAGGKLLLWTPSAAFRCPVSETERWEKHCGKTVDKATTLAAERNEHSAHTYKVFVQVRCSFNEHYQSISAVKCYDFYRKLGCLFPSPSFA